MEAKEIKEIVETYWQPNISKSQLEVIAEISFKAGIKEVVEWVEQNCYAYTEDTWMIPSRKWQAKLKEWGID